MSWSICFLAGGYQSEDLGLHNQANVGRGSVEKVDLKAFDQLMWAVAWMVRAFMDKGCVTMPLCTGEVLEGKLRDYWVTNPEQAKLVCKCVDLKSAYKQLPLSPDDA